MNEPRRDLAGELAALHARAFGWALTLCRWDRASAEEVLSVTYEKVLAGTARFDGRSRFATWLYAVIRRTAQAERRRRWLVAVRLQGAPPPLEPVDPERLLGGEEEARRVRAALLRLPARQREVLDLVFYHELTVAEAAVAMGVSLGSARQHYDRGKRRLEELVSCP